MMSQASRLSLYPPEGISEREKRVHLNPVELFCLKSCLCVVLIFGSALIGAQTVLAQGSIEGAPVGSDATDHAAADTTLPSPFYSSSSANHSQGLSPESTSEALGFFLKPHVAFVPRKSVGKGLGIGYIWDTEWHSQLYVQHIKYQRGRVRYKNLEVGGEGYRYWSPWCFMSFGLNYQLYHEHFHNAKIAPSDGSSAKHKKYRLSRGIVHRGMWAKLGTGGQLSFDFPYFQIKSLSIGMEAEWQLLLWTVDQVTENFHPLGGDLLGLKDSYLGGRLYLSVAL